MQKINHYVLRGTIELLSGMRIGGSDDTLQPGSFIDLSCIRDPVTREPYIPGSSIKGKMRSSLERKLGRLRKGRDGRLSDPCGCAEDDCPVCRVFGPHMKPDHGLGPTRIIVRDAPIQGSYEIENKSSTAIDRSTGTALRGALRTEERVGRGAKFALEIAIQEFDIDAQFKYKNADGDEVGGHDALLEVVDHALWEMEQIGIGAGTGKGSGLIKIHWDGKVEKCKRTSRARTIGEGPCIQPAAAS